MFSLPLLRYMRQGFAVVFLENRRQISSEQPTVQEGRERIPLSPFGNTRLAIFGPRFAGPVYPLSAFLLQNIERLVQLIIDLRSLLLCDVPVKILIGSHENIRGNGVILNFLAQR